MQACKFEAIVVPHRQSMHFYKKSVRPELSPYVKNCWLIELKEDEVPFSQLYFPYGAFELICYVKGSPNMKFIDGREIFKTASFFLLRPIYKAICIAF